MPHLRGGIAPARLLRAGVLAAAALLTLSFVAGPTAADRTVVRLIQPDSGDVALGETEILISARAAEGTRILKVEIYVDDRLIATLLDPPWEYVWDAGDVMRPRRVRVKAYSSDGATATDEAVTRVGAGVVRAVVDLVEIFATVKDQQGGYLMDLTQEDFTVLDEGKPQPLAVFSAERRPVHLVLLIDASNSMNREGRIAIARDAAVGFLEELEPEDTAALITFSDTPRVIMERTPDKKAVAAAARAIEAEGGTALYDALLDAVGMLRDHEGRKAIILLSDGRDEAVDGLGPGSVTTFEEALDAVLESETAIYAIGTGEGFEEEMDFHRRHSLGEILGTLARRSGGRAYFVKKASKLDNAYGAIEDELRHHYTLAYYPPPIDPKIKPDARGRIWREIEVRVSRRRATVTARDGYFAR